MKILRNYTICFDRINSVSFLKGKDSGDLSEEQVEKLVKAGVVLDPNLSKKDAEKKLEIILKSIAENKAQFEKENGSTIVPRTEWERLKKLEASLHGSSGSPMAAEKQNLLDEIKAFEAEKEEFEENLENLKKDFEEKGTSLEESQKMLCEAQESLEAEKAEFAAQKEEAIDLVKKDRSALDADIKAFQKKKNK